MGNFFRYWFPPLFWMAFLFPLTNSALSAQSTSSTIIPIIEPLVRWFLPNAGQDLIHAVHVLIRKGIHFCEYFILAYLWFRAFKGRKTYWQWEWVKYAGIITISYAALDEFLQSLMATRTGLFTDWLIDTVGASVALGIIYLENTGKERKTVLGQLSGE